MKTEPRPDFDGLLVPMAVPTPAIDAIPTPFADTTPLMRLWSVDERAKQLRAVTREFHIGFTLREVPEIVSFEQTTIYANPFQLPA